MNNDSIFTVVRSQQDGLSVRCIKDNVSTVLGNENSEQNVDVTTLSNIEIEKKVEKPKEIIIDRPIPSQYENHTTNDNVGQTEQLEVLDNDDTIYNIVELMPEFPGGEAGLQDFLSKMVKYPADAAQHGIEGKVFVNFVIIKDGSVTESRIVRGVDPMLDAEALRVVKSFPKWIPGKQGGKVVNVSFTVPVNFKLK